MATHLDYDLDSRVIYVTTAPSGGVLTLHVQRDIYSAVKQDWKTNATLARLKLPFFPKGGFGITPQQDLTPYYLMRAGWSMRPYESSHTLYLENGVLVTEAGGDPWDSTLGAYTVKIRDVVPSDARAVVVPTGSALTAEEHAWLSQALKVGQFTALK